MEQPGLIIARALVYGTMLPATGLPIYALAAGQAAWLSRRARLAAIGLAALAALASLWWLLEDIAAMAAVPLDALDRATVEAVAGATPLGLALGLRLGALGLLVLALLVRWPALVAALAGIGALATMALTGHAGAGEGLPGMAHCLADTAHLAAAACWIGALLVFVAGCLGPARRPPLADRLARFAGLGTLLVGVLLATGIANTLLITGWPLPLHSGWTRLLLAKLALFAAMLGCAGLNRWVLVPALERHEPRAAIHLRRSLACELAAGLAILLLVAQLGTLDPSA